MRYLQPVPEQMQDISCFLPSMISYNARALNASSIDIMERINWLNSQQSVKTAYSNAHNIVKEFSKFSLENKTQISTVSMQNPSCVYIYFIYIIFFSNKANHYNNHYIIIELIKCYIFYMYDC